MVAPSYRSAGTTASGDATSTISVSVPSGVAVDDIVVAMIWSEADLTITPPAGAGTWAYVSGFPLTVGTGPDEAHIFWKRATGSDAGSYSFTKSPTGSSWVSRGAIAVSGCVNSGDPWEADSGLVNVSTYSATRNVDMDTATADTFLLLVTLASAGDEGVWTLPSSPWTSPLGNNPGRNHNFSYNTQGAAGNTGSASLTTSNGGNDNLVSWMGALKSTAGGGGGGVTIPRLAHNYRLRRAR